MVNVSHFQLDSIAPENAAILPTGAGVHRENLAGGVPHQEGIHAEHEREFSLDYIPIFIHYLVGGRPLLRERSAGEIDV